MSEQNQKQRFFSHTRKLTIEWGHCDAAGIVFNPRFFEYFDWSTALLLFAASGMNKKEMLAAHGVAGAPLVATQATFLKTCSFGDEVSIVSSVIKVGTSSFDVEHRLFKGHELAVEGNETRVWVGFESGQLKSRPLPEGLASRLRQPAG
jgi:4-hydroxybenzoyl-CoA thioesterase